MNKTHQTTWAILLCFAAAGCSSPCLTVKDESFREQLGPDERLSLARCVAAHPPGNVAAFTSGFALGLVGGGVLLATVPKNTLDVADLQAENISSEGSYLARLDRKCLKEIENVLAGSDLFSYVGTSALRCPREKPGKEQAYVWEVIKANSLKAVLGIGMSYEWMSGELALMVNWRVYGPDGKLDAVIKTMVKGGGKLSIIDPRDPKYENLYLELARKSAEDFVAILTTGEPKHGPKRIPTSLAP
ncbi:MAG: hypothetical protein SVM79_07105 [Chloroflexota bacterium]|nr:hypothetical protein [Chloroflexota bacterium]